MLVRIPRCSVTLRRLMSASRTTPPPASLPAQGHTAAATLGSSTAKMVEQGAAADEVRAAAGQQRDKALPLALPPLEEDNGGSSSSSSSSRDGGKGSGSGDDSGRGDGVTTLRVGESIRLDAMGPLVVNTDGSMARVANWAGMTGGEREATLRMLGRRNKQRLEALKAKKRDAEKEGTAAAAGNGGNTGKE